MNNKILVAILLVCGITLIVGGGLSNRIDFMILGIFTGCPIGYLIKQLKEAQK